MRYSKILAPASFTAIATAILLLGGIAQPTAAADSAQLKLPIRIKAGVSAPLKDEAGVEWLADQGFAGGETIERPGIAISNTKTPSLYQSERYSMTGFSCAVPNGKYLVKLHFAETFEEIDKPGQRIFSFNVEGKEFKDFDPVAKTGAARRAYIESVEIEVKDGKVDVIFTSKVENPEINAIEIIPR